MLIALDYDGTYTADPELFLAFISMAKERGHEVVCVTARNTEEASIMCPDLIGSVEVIATDRASKAHHMASLGRMPKVWIDDNPHKVFTGW